MSNFEFMKQQRIIDDYSAFNKMYQYLVFAEKNFYFNHQLCGMNVRWALEQFCCLVTDLKEIKYDTKPTYMGQFLSSENRLKLLLAVNGEVNYRTICEINSISREYAHSITPPNEDLYGEMLPKMYGLIVWLYEVLLGIKLGLTYGGFSYDKIAQDEDILFVKKEDVVYTSKEQVERIRRKFPNCDTSLLYSIRKNDEKFELLDENDNVVETYINEEFITVDDDLLLENASLSAVQEQLLHTLEMQESEKKKLEEKVGSLSYEIEQAEKRINNLQEKFQAQTDAYKVLVQLKNVLVQEKKNLEEKLFKVQSEYKNLNAVLQEEIISFKEDRVQLQTLLSNAEAQVVYYRALVKKYTSKMKENNGYYDTTKIAVPDMDLEYDAWTVQYHTSLNIQLGKKYE